MLAVVFVISRGELEITEMIHRIDAKPSLRLKWEAAKKYARRIDPTAAVIEFERNPPATLGGELLVVALFYYGEDRLRPRVEKIASRFEFDSPVTDAAASHAANLLSTREGAVVSDIQDNEN